MPAAELSAVPDPLRIVTICVEPTMQQVLCGVEERIVVDGYQFRVVEVTPDVVTLELLVGDSSRRRHDIKLVSAAPKPRGSQRVSDTQWL